jgi:hypothetical protein
MEKQPSMKFFRELNEKEYEKEARGMGLNTERSGWNRLRVDLRKLGFRHIESLRVWSLTKGNLTFDDWANYQAVHQRVCEVAKKNSWAQNHVLIHDYLLVDLSEQDKYI